MADTNAELAAKLREALEEVWDDGNCTGLDGWVGLGRGADHVDNDALHSQERVINKVMPQIIDALKATEGKAKAFDPRCRYEFSLPSWMGANQANPCRCDLPVGHLPTSHDSKHSCPHIRGEKAAS